ncbi:pre-mRNA-splicing factor isy1 [Anaeramoeba flamelloides]|uniref:Pre-mRNA-splicing factor isy1 n=1 Tax=Anaeramoeba flamelloides TaxID=1746091 RepID=A0ABQ8XMV3_9EUKA|nr:pre-mRNA-splicing factor isy1 [Anaeramoeba flamelloides]
MARNEEKANAMLNRFIEMEKKQQQGPKRRMPRNPQDCRNLKQAEKWREVLVRKISKKVTEIHKETLSEFRIRSLNDEINYLIRKKIDWEERIMELGGTNYLEVLFKDSNERKKIIQEKKVYKYFGTSRKLEGTKMFLENEKITSKISNVNTNLRERVNYQYYGFSNEQDQELEKEEKIVENIGIVTYYGFTSCSRGGLLTRKNEIVKLLFFSLNEF